MKQLTQYSLKPRWYSILLAHIIIFFLISQQYWIQTKFQHKPDHGQSPPTRRIPNGRINFYSHFLFKSKKNIHLGPLRHHVDTNILKVRRNRAHNLFCALQVRNWRAWWLNVKIWNNFENNNFHVRNWCVWLWSLQETNRACMCFLI